MPTQHSRDSLHFQYWEDEDLQAKLTLKEFFNALVFFFFSIFLIRLYLKINSNEKTFSPLLSFRPRNIQWSKINDTLPERAEISGPTFQISRLSQSHNGTYLCQAQNDYGRAADHYTLLVYGKSLWPAGNEFLLSSFVSLVVTVDRLSLTQFSPADVQQTFALSEI